MKPKRRLTIVQDVLQNLDRITRELGDGASEIAYKAKATCSADCGSGCCYQLFSIPFPEGLQLAKWLIDQNRVTEDLMARLHAAKAKTVTGSAFKEPHDYFLEKNPCVFLDDTEHCTVYDGRPLTCRLYYVVTDPKLCHPDRGDVSQDDIGRISRDEFHKIRDKAWPIAESELGLPMNCRGIVGPLPVMVLLGLTYLAGGPDAVISLLKPQTAPS